MTLLGRKPGRFFWKLFLGNATLMALVLASAVWAILHQFERFREDDLVEQLVVQAAALVPAVHEHLSAARGEELDELVKHISTEIAAATGGGIRITVVAPDGTVLGDSEAEPREMDGLGLRPEIEAALRDGRGQHRRWSETAFDEMWYVAVRVGPPDQPAGVVRIATAVEHLGTRAEPPRTMMWGLAFVFGVSAVFLALGLARLWSNRIDRITATAQQLAQGDLTVRAPVSGSDEVDVLARSLNRMRRRLSRQLATIDRQRRNVEALIGQLHEGVIAADQNGHILFLNPAAERLLDIARESPASRNPARGRAVEECIPQHALQKLLLSSSAITERAQTESGRADLGPEQAEQEGKVEELRLEVDGPGGPRTLLARASNVAFPAWQLKPRSRPRRTATGRLLVLTDITDLARTLRVKTDFVANASHELRTPLSAIRAAVETLQHIDPVREPQAVGRFLDVLNRHSARLEALVADLLDLSRIESCEAPLRPAVLKIRELCEDVHAQFAEALVRRKLHWSCQVAESCSTVFADAHLLRLILDHLVDNAIKFTPPGGHVGLVWRVLRPDVVVEVVDDGCGIAPEEKERVFERFYQVSRARSAQRGEDAETRGTGLGLSIVKHAVAALQGSIELESTPGKGTRVIVRLPVDGRGAIV